MGDLISRQAAIDCEYQVKIINDIEYVMLSEVQMKMRKLPSADRPQGEWIFHYRDKWMVKAECPKCHRRFEFSPRWIWKCCPMCETRMKGVSNEADSDKSK